MLKYSISAIPVNNFNVCAKLQYIWKLIYTLNKILVLFYVKRNRILNYKRILIKFKMLTIQLQSKIVFFVKDTVTDSTRATKN